MENKLSVTLTESFKAVVSALHEATESLVSEQADLEQQALEIGRKMRANADEQQAIVGMVGELVEELGTVVDSATIDADHADSTAEILESIADGTDDE